MSTGKRRGRGLSADEHALWTGVTRAIAPLRPRQRRAAQPGSPPDEEPASPAGPRPQPVSSLPVAVRPAKPAAPPPLATLERRLRQRVARGATPIDARIDLHGLTLSEAHHALARFVRRAQADGARIVLVVTGKGRAAGVRDFAGERGVLRRQVPLWLQLPEFRGYVVGFEAAHVAHGGEGAIYVRVRRGRLKSN